MTVQEYIDAEYTIILTHPIVKSSDLMRHTVNRLDGYLRVRCTLINEDFLEIALHVTRQAENIVLDDYRYQWMDSTRRTLHRRWDNTPHFRHIASFPHHCHVGQEDDVEPSVPMNIKELLDCISNHLDSP